MKTPKFLINSYRKQLFKAQNLSFKVHTVCEEAKCPNRGECFSKGTVTFLLLGNICTRNCLYCNVSTGKPAPPEDESAEILKAIKHFNLKYVVLTSVTRDDLPDGGASVFVKVMNTIKHYDSTIKVEVLVPDFNENLSAIDAVCNATPFVFNHNLEVVPSLFSSYRPSGDFKMSLNILGYVRDRYVNIHTKTGILVGLGEKTFEVLELTEMLGDEKIGSLTIGQYLKPAKNCADVVRYLEPEEYEEFTKHGKKHGVKVIAGPLVRSSYLAHEVF